MQISILSELNRAICTLLTRLNTRPFRKLPGCRQALFEALDRPALRPLPDAPYVYAEWRKARVCTSTSASRSTAWRPPVRGAP